jgi:protein-S-isoprenylcysteine O-methyltransferase Ste14
VVKTKLSFGNIKVFNGIQEALVLALMLISVLALFYVDMDITYKIGIAVIVFAIIFLATLATTLLRQQKEIKQTQA